MDRMCSVATVEYPAKLEAVAEGIYRQPGDARLDLFKDIHSVLPGDTVHPGSILAIPHSTDFDITAKENASALVAADNGNRTSLTIGQAETHNDEFSLLEFISRHKQSIDLIQKEADGLDTYFGKRIELIEKDLAKLNGTYNDALQGGVKLSSKAFSQSRKGVEARLRAQINGIAKKNILKNSQASNFKKSIGISHKSIQKNFSMRGATDVKAITRTTDRTKAFASKLKPIGYVGRLLNAGLVIESGATAYKKDGAIGVADVAAQEGAGAVGAWAGRAAGLKLALLFGAGTGGVGFVVIGVAVVAGSMLGSELGKGTYAFSRDAVVEWIVD